jgi:protein gp37
MGAKTGIEWTDATWPIVQGCDYESPGCTHCYAVPLIWRLAHNPNPKISAPLQGLVKKLANGNLAWTGKLALRQDRMLDPLGWREPRRIFVPSHGDIFHADVPDTFLDQIFAVMALCPQHTFQVLTKRADRMRRYVAETGKTLGRQGTIREAVRELTPWPEDRFGEHIETARAITRVSGTFKDREPLPNVWLGVSVEDQARADARIPLLLGTPAAKRFLSCEPLLGAVDLTEIEHAPAHCIHALWGLKAETDGTAHYGPRIDWVIAGGESGDTARPMHPDWARSLRDQCRAAGVPFFFKQWGEWAPVSAIDLDAMYDQLYFPVRKRNPEGVRRARVESTVLHRDGSTHDVSTDENAYLASASPMLNFKLGKSRSGRLLDGREWSEFPS